MNSSSYFRSKPGGCQRLISGGCRNSTETPRGPPRAGRAWHVSGAIPMRSRCSLDALPPRFCRVPAALLVPFRRDLPRFCRVYGAPPMRFCCASVAISPHCRLISVGFVLGCCRVFAGFLSYSRWAAARKPLGTCRNPADFQAGRARKSGEDPHAPARRRAGFLPGFQSLAAGGSA